MDQQIVWADDLIVHVLYISKAALHLGLRGKLGRAASSQARRVGGITVASTPLNNSNFHIRTPHIQPDSMIPWTLRVPGPAANVVLLRKSPRGC